MSNLTSEKLNSIPETQSFSTGVVTSDKDNLLLGSETRAVFPGEDGHLHLGTSSVLVSKFPMNLESSRIKDGDEYRYSEYESFLSLSSSVISESIDFSRNNSLANRGASPELTMVFFHEYMRTELNRFFIKNMPNFRELEVNSKRVIPFINLSYVELDDDGRIIKPFGGVDSSKKYKTKEEVEASVTGSGDASSNISGYFADLVDFKFIPHEVIGNICAKISSFLKDDILGQQVSIYEYVTPDGLRPSDCLSYYKYIFLNEESDSEVVNKINSMSTETIDGKDLALGSLLSFLLPSSRVGMISGSNPTSSKGFFTVVGDKIAAKVPVLSQTSRTFGENLSFSFKSSNIILGISGSYSSGKLGFFNALNYVVDYSPISEVTSGSEIVLDSNSDFSEIMNFSFSPFEKNRESLGIYGPYISKSKIILSPISLEKERVRFPRATLPYYSYEASKNSDSSPIVDVEDIKQRNEIFSATSPSNDYYFLNGNIYSLYDDLSTEYKFNDNAEVLDFSFTKGEKGLGGNFNFYNKVEDDFSEYVVIDLENDDRVSVDSGRVKVLERKVTFEKFSDENVGLGCSKLRYKAYYLDRYNQFFPISFKKDEGGSGYISNSMDIVHKKPSISEMNINFAESSFEFIFSGKDLENCNSATINFLSEELTLDFKNLSDAINVSISDDEIKISSSVDFETFVQMELPNSFYISAQLSSTFSNSSVIDDKIKVSDSKVQSNSQTAEISFDFSSYVADIKYIISAGDLTLIDSVSGLIPKQQINYNGTSILKWKIENELFKNNYSNIYCHILIEDYDFEEISVQQIAYRSGLTLELYDDNFLVVSEASRKIGSSSSDPIFVKGDELILDFFKLLEFEGNAFNVDYFSLLRRSKIVFSESRYPSPERFNLDGYGILSFDSVGYPFVLPPYIDRIFKEDGGEIAQNTNRPVEDDLLEYLDFEFGTKKIKGFSKNGALNTSSKRSNKIGLSFFCNPEEDDEFYSVFINDKKTKIISYTRSSDRRKMFVVVKTDPKNSSQGSFKFRVEYSKTDRFADSTKNISFVKEIDDQTFFNQLETQIIDEDIDMEMLVSEFQFSEFDNDEELLLPSPAEFDSKAEMRVLGSANKKSEPSGKKGLDLDVSSFLVSAENVVENIGEKIENSLSSFSISIKTTALLKGEDESQTQADIESKKRDLIAKEIGKLVNAQRKKVTFSELIRKFKDPDCGILNIKKSSPLSATLKTFDNTGEDPTSTPSKRFFRIKKKDAYGLNATVIKAGSKTEGISYIAYEDAEGASKYKMITLVPMRDTDIVTNIPEIVSVNGNEDVKEIIVGEENIIKFSGDKAYLNLSGIGITDDQISEYVTSLSLGEEDSKTVSQVLRGESSLQDSGIDKEDLSQYKGELIGMLDEPGSLDITPESLDITPESLDISIIDPALENVPPSSNIERAPCDDPPDEKNRDLGKKIAKGIGSSLEFVGTKINDTMDELGNVQSFCDYSFGLTKELKLELRGFEKVLTVIKVIFCIIDVLCAFPNTIKMSKAIIRLFDCLWDLVLMLPQVAIPAMLLSILEHLLELVKCVFEKIIYYSNAINEIIAALENAYEEGDLVSLQKLEETLSKYIISLEQSIDVLRPILEIIDIFRRFLDLVFNIPCQPGDSENIFCIEDQLASAIFFDKSKNPENLLMFAQTYSTEAPVSPCGNTPEMDNLEDLSSSKVERKNVKCKDQWDLSDGKVLAFSGLAKGEVVFDTSATVESSINMSNLRSENFSFEGSLKASASKIIKAPLSDSFSWDSSSLNNITDPKRVYISFGNNLDFGIYPNSNVNPKGLTSKLAFETFYRNFFSSKNIAREDNLDDSISLLSQNQSRVEIASSARSGGLFSLYSSDMIDLGGSVENGKHPKNVVFDLEGNDLEYINVPSFLIVDGDGDVYAIEKNGIKFDSDGRIKGIFAKIISENNAISKRYSKEEELIVSDQNTIDEQSNAEALLPLFLDAGVSYSNREYGRKTGEVSSYAEFIKNKLSLSKTISQIEEMMVNPEAGLYDYINGTDSEVETYQNAVSLTDVYKFVDIFFLDVRSAQEEIIASCNSQTQSGVEFPAVSDIIKVNEETEDCVNGVVDFVNSGIQNIKDMLNSGSISGFESPFSRESIYSKYRETVDCIESKVDDMCNMVISPVSTEFKIIGDTSFEPRDDVVNPNSYPEEIESFIETSRFESSNSRFIGATDYANGIGDNISISTNASAIVMVTPRTFDDNTIGSDFSEKISINIEEDTTGSVEVSDVYRSDSEDSYFFNVSSKNEGVVQISCSICRKYIKAFTYQGFEGDFDGEDCLSSEQIVSDIANNIIKTTKTVLKIEFSKNVSLAESFTQKVENDDSNKTLLPGLNYRG